MTAPSRLWAISDLHVGFEQNCRIVENILAHPTDWLVLGGDIGEHLDDLRFVVDTSASSLRPPALGARQPRPGDDDPRQARSVGGTKSIARPSPEPRPFVTPEDPYPIFDDGRERHLLAPLFLLYDYSFCPKGMAPRDALAWARESGLECADEHVLYPDPFASRQAWCAQRCAASERRLTAALSAHAGNSVLVNHYPLRQELAVLPRIPRFSIWCGTKRTEDWHTRFRASAVVYGHLHIPATHVIDGVRFEEVSLGYPRQQSRFSHATSGLRQILPYGNRTAA